MWELYTDNEHIVGNDTTRVATVTPYGLESYQRPYTAEENAAADQAIQA